MGWRRCAKGDSRRSDFPLVDKVRIQPLRMSADRIAQIERGEKTITRRLVTKSNSKVKPGTWDNLVLQSGHVSRTASRRDQRSMAKALRVPCNMPAGQRMVSVTSTIRTGDLLWVRQGQHGIKATRAGSSLTLLVTDVVPSRLMDISLEDLRAEGFADWRSYVDFWRAELTAASFRANPWVWSYRFIAHALNIDDYLARFPGERLEQDQAETAGNGERGGGGDFQRQNLPRAHHP